MSLIRLPIEIISLTTKLLDIEDIFNLGSSCHHFSYLLQSETICRQVLLKKAGFAVEATEARASCAYAKSLRRIAKRRNAVRQGEPFAVALVAMGEHFIYTNGILCYNFNSQYLHVLDVHHSATKELVIKVPWMLEREMPGFHREQQYSFRPLHCSQGILSCIYSNKESRGNMVNWLIVLCAKTGHLITSQRLASVQKLFVRNDSNYLVCGTNSRIGFDGFKRWSLQKFDLKAQKWSETETVLWNFVGSDINVDACFEIFDNHLYCVSNKTRFQPEHGKWNSYYTVLRFPLSDITRDAVCSPPMQNLWRRHAAEGPVDDRWNSIQLTRDEKSGGLFIFESRRECLVKNAQSQRTCYKKELNFDIDGCNPILATLTDIAGDAFLVEESSDDESEADHDANAWNSERHFETRLPEDIHVGDSGTVYSIHECFIWYYNPSCETFLDLINESETLQLRVRPKTRYGPMGIMGNVIEANQSFPTRGLEEARDVHHEAKLWPPKPVPPPLDNILSPQRSFKDIEWFMDERSLVYAPGVATQGRPRPLVLISFDPTIHLPGYPRRNVSNITVSPIVSSSRSHLREGCPKNAVGSSASQCSTSVSSNKDLTSRHDTMVGNEASQQESISPLAHWAKSHEALYLRIPKTEESPCGLDFAL